MQKTTVSNPKPSIEQAPNDLCKQIHFCLHIFYWNYLVQKNIWQGESDDEHTAVDQFREQFVDVFIGYKVASFSESRFSVIEHIKVIDLQAQMLELPEGISTKSANLEGCDALLGTVFT